MTKEELMSAIMGLPAETQVYTINDYADLRRRVRTLLATGRYLLTIDYRKKDINNEK